MVIHTICKKTCWVNGFNFVVGWNAEKEGEIDWIFLRGDSEAIQEIKEAIHKFKPDKDYTYSPSVEVDVWGKMGKYTILDSQLKKKLWKCLESDKALNDHKKAMKKHDRIMKEHDKIMKKHDKISKLHEKFIETLNKIDEGKENNSEITIKKNPVYVRKYCPNHGFKEVVSTYKYCSECGCRFGAAKNINNFEKEDKNQWKWREFWIGASIALILAGLSFLLIKLLRKKK